MPKSNCEDLWIGMMYQTELAKFDPKQEKFEIIPIPAELNSDVSQQSMVMPSNAAADGKVWTNKGRCRAKRAIDAQNRANKERHPALAGCRSI
jgi:hypothetical protein